MTRLATLKKLLLQGVCAAAFATLIGFQTTVVSAEAAAQLWSIGIHFEYQNGTVVEFVLASGLSTREMSSMLAECGQSHWTGSVVRYHCFPIPE